VKGGGFVRAAVNETKTATAHVSAETARAHHQKLNGHKFHDRLMVFRLFVMATTEAKSPSANLTPRRDSPPG
jgi:hypothetical protein